MSEKYLLKDHPCSYYYRENPAALAEPKLLEIPAYRRMVSRFGRVVLHPRTIMMLGTIAIVAGWAFEGHANIVDAGKTALLADLGKQSALVLQLVGKDVSGTLRKQGLSVISMAVVENLAQYGFNVQGSTNAAIIETATARAKKIYESISTELESAEDLRQAVPWADQIGARVHEAVAQYRGETFEGGEIMDIPRFQLRDLDESDAFQRKWNNARNWIADYSRATLPRMFGGEADASKTLLEFTGEDIEDRVTTAVEAIVRNMNKRFKWFGTNRNKRLMATAPYMIKAVISFLVTTITTMRWAARQATEETIRRQKAVAAPGEGS